MDVDLTSLAGPSLWPTGNITVHVQGCPFALMARYFISLLYFLSSSSKHKTGGKYKGFCHRTPATPNGGLL